MNLNEYYDYKNQLMKDLLTSDEVVQLLNDEFEPHRTAEELQYTQVFPYEYLPETVEEGRTYICFDVDVQKSVNKTFYLPTIYVWVFTHKSKMRLPEGGVRVDNLCSEICKIMNGSRFYGLGELQFYSSKRFAPLQDWQGKVLTFDATDFALTHPTGKPIPSNRKRGV